MGITSAVAAMFYVAAVAVALKLFFELLEAERRSVEARIRHIDKELKKLEKPVSASSREKTPAFR